MSWGKISAVLAAIVLMGSAWATVDDYRWWAWASEVRQVAEVSYGTALARQDDALVRIKILIAECKANSNCSRAALENLEQQKSQVEALIRQLKDDESRLK